MAIVVYMQFAEAIPRFISYLQFEKRFSQHTIRAYSDDLQQCSEYLLAQFDCNDVTVVSSLFIRSWLASLKDNEASAKTINRKISTLKSFYRFLRKENIASQNPTSQVVSQKLNKRLPQFVDKADMERLFRHAEFTDDWNGRTECLVIQLLYQTGMRLSEVTGLKETHVDKYHHSIKVLGKGNKERMIPCHAVLIASLLQYKNDKPAIVENVNTDVLFVTDKGKKLYAKWVYRAVRKQLDKATTIDKRSPHVLRHSFATHLLNEGAELNAVKELLGHSSLAATQVYTHNTIEKLKEVFKNAHPKA
jgi:integrase/recombinase XerC